MNERAFLPNRRWLHATVAALVGCGGPSEAVLQEQNKQRLEDYEAAKKNPPNLSPKEKQRRARRLEMDYGDLDAR